MKNIKGIHIFSAIGLVIFSLISFFFFQNINLQKIIQEKPKDIVVTDISTVESQIYWKADEQDIHRIYYKEESNSGLYKKVEGVQIYKDSGKKQRIYSAKVVNLKPDTEYLFRIQSQNNLWDEKLSFKTKPLSEEIQLPEITTGTDIERSLVLVNINGENVMLDTQYHGTWAFDSKGKEYSKEIYANYSTNEELRAKLRSYLFSPVLAESGANCSTNISVNSSTYAPSKAKTVNILNRWVASCPSGGYPDECYEDIYCKSVKAGVNPAFAISIWSNESGGSNYAYSSNVEDLGIHTASTPRNFTRQLDWFLGNIASKGEDYISGCSGTNKIESWGAKFLTGNCTDPVSLEKGKEYMDGISNIYSWYTNEPLQWPFTIPAAEICDYSKAYVNSAYNSCTSKGKQTDTSKPSTSSNGDGAKDYMIVNDLNRDCKDPDGCICLYGYNDSNAQSTLEIPNGNTCTPDQQSITTPAPVENKPEEKICCSIDSTLSVTEKSKCKGIVLSNVKTENCKETNTKLILKQGVNFIEAKEVLNKTEVPIKSAKDLITYTEGKVLSVGFFRNDRWEKVVKNENGSVNGEDFNLEPGEPYMVVSAEAFEIPYATVRTTIKALSLETLVGWNLVPSSLFSSVSTSSKTILLDPRYSYLKQLAIWDNNTSKFEYTLKNIGGELFGENLNISEQEGFFVKTSN